MYQRRILLTMFIMLSQILHVLFIDLTFTHLTYAFNSSHICEEWENNGGHRKVSMMFLCILFYQPVKKLIINHFQKQCT